MGASKQIQAKYIEPKDPSCNLEIVIERKSNIEGAIVPMKIFINDELITKLGNKKAVRFKVPRGVIKLTVQLWSKTDSRTFTANECGKPVNITVTAESDGGIVKPVILKISDTNKPHNKPDMSLASALDIKVPSLILQNSADGHIDAYHETYKWFIYNKDMILGRIFETMYEKLGGWDNSTFEITGISGISRNYIIDEDLQEREDPDGEFAIEVDMYQNGTLSEFVDNAAENAAFLFINCGVDYYEEDIGYAVINCYTKETVYEVYGF